MNLGRVIKAQYDVLAFDNPSSCCRIIFDVNSIKRSKVYKRYLVSSATFDSRFVKAMCRFGYMGCN